jgi:hypothetical protein
MTDGARLVRGERRQEGSLKSQVARHQLRIIVAEDDADIRRWIRIVRACDLRRRAAAMDAGAGGWFTRVLRNVTR